MSLVPESSAALDLSRDPSSVVEFLERSKWALDVAVEMTGPAEVARLKAQVVMAETYSRELNLSKDIREQATEMVRRAEYALGRALRKGQEEGTIRTVGQRAPQSPYIRVRHGQEEAVQAGSEVPTTCLPGIKDIAPDFYANGSELPAMAKATPTEFEEALAEAKAEGNLSRANVVRKVKGQADPVHKSRAAKADLLEELAQQGYSSRQMCKALGFSRDDAVRELAREYDIDIPADKSVTRTRRINSTSLVENTATALEGLVMGVELIDYKAVDPEVASQWVDSLTESMRALNRFVRQLKEQTQ